jgi:hypothetical protein
MKPNGSTGRPNTPNSTIGLQVLLLIIVLANILAWRFPNYFSGNTPSYLWLVLVFVGIPLLFVILKRQTKQLSSVAGSVKIAGQHNLAKISVAIMLLGGGIGLGIGFSRYAGIGVSGYFAGIFVILASVFWGAIALYLTSVGQTLVLLSNAWRPVIRIFAALWIVATFVAAFFLATAVESILRPQTE